MITDPWHVSVLIPARDEEDLLPRCLESVLEARAALAGMATCDVIVAVDRSIGREQVMLSEAFNRVRNEVWLSVRHQAAAVETQHGVA